jgi:type III secretion protein T
MPAAPLDISFLKVLIAVGAVAMARTTGMFAVTPFLGRGMLTGLARNGVILSLTLPVLPYVFAHRPPDFDPTNLPVVLALTLKELLIGVLLGLPLAAIAWGLEAAGFVIDNQRGATMASSLNPATGNQSSPIGILLAQLYTTWLFVAGGFAAMLDLLYRSHVLWPAWSFTPVLNAAFPGQMLRLLDTVMRLSLLMAGPALIAMFLSEFGLALVSRFAPQLQVFFLAMPLKSGVGLLLLLLSIGVILDEASHELLSVPRLLRLIGSWLS